MKRIVVCASVVGALLLGSCGSGSEDGSEDQAESSEDVDVEKPEVGDRIEGLAIDGQPRLAFEVVGTGLRAPSGLASPPGDDRIFALERISGQVRIIEDGTLLPEPFLDVRDRLEPSGSTKTQEDGLLRIAFHPEYADNGRFFIYYADQSGREELVEYRVSDDDPYKADPESAVVLGQYGPATQHHGGALFFGPDGALWFGLGDPPPLPPPTTTSAGGGRSESPDPGVTQERGAIYRFDASTPGVLAPAEGNPYIGDVVGIDEMWAYGVRNPWTMSIDAETGMLYVADVGRSHVEEINVVPMGEAGLNYGWPIVEGTRCVYADPDACDATGTVSPALEVVRGEDAAGICSIIGGSVYRGEAIPELQGAYLYTDYCGGFLRSFRFENGVANDEIEWFDNIDNVNSTMADDAGEFYVADSGVGSILKLVPA